MAGLPLFRAPPKGLAATLMWRLRRAGWRELGIVAIGLALLAMLPLAEDSLTRDENESGNLVPEFGRKAALFDEEGRPFEDGVRGIAPGALMGKVTDVVTPMEGRGSLDFIMGGALKDALSPGNASQKSSPGEPAAVARPRPSARSEWSAALKTATKAAARSLARRSPALPRPPARFTSKLSAIASSPAPASAATVRLPPISPKGLVGSPRKEMSMVRVMPTVNFRGAGARSRAAGVSARVMNGQPLRPPMATEGAGSTFLEPAMGAAFSGAGGGGASSSAGEANAVPGSGAAKDTKSISAPTSENLGELRAKMEMEKQLALKWDKKRYEELERRKMTDQIMAQTLAQTAQQAALKLLDALLGNNQEQDQDQAVQAQPAQQQRQAQPQQLLAQAQPPPVDAGRQVAASFTGEQLLETLKGESEDLRAGRYLALILGDNPRNIGQIRVQGNTFEFKGRSIEIKENGMVVASGPAGTTEFRPLESDKVLVKEEGVRKLMRLNPLSGEFEEVEAGLSYVSEFYGNQIELLPSAVDERLRVRVEIEGTPENFSVLAYDLKLGVFTVRDANGRKYDLIYNNISERFDKYLKRSE